MADVEQIKGAKKCGLFCYLYYRMFILIITPAAFSPIIILNYSHPYQCLYILCCMAVYWVTEALPIHITAMIPLVAYPGFGILSSNDVCMTYFGSASVMFLAGIMLAISIEFSQLHIRVALNTTICIGVNIRKLHFSTMIITAFLSIWLPNLATASMMCPIVGAILEELQANNMADMYEGKKTDDPDRVPTAITKSFFIGVAFASSIGGSASLIGTSTNMVVKGIYETRYPDDTAQLQFLNFLLYMIIPMIILLLFTTMMLQIIYLGLFRPHAPQPISQKAEEEIRNIVLKKLAELGNLSTHEILTLILFIFAIGLCCTIKVGDFGWEHLIHPNEPQMIKNSATFVLVVFIMFIMPKAFECCNFCRSNKPLPTTQTTSVLDWAYMNRKFPWHLIFLLGGGFATAKGLKVSGASDWMADKMIVLEDFPPLGALFITFMITLVFTNFTTNVAIANIVLPILVELAASLKVHPLYYLLPCGIACSYSFMLPVGTPPNALVALYANIPTSDFLISGIFPTLISIVIFPLLFPVWGKIIFPHAFDHVPART